MNRNIIRDQFFTYFPCASQLLPKEQVNFLTPTSLLFLEIRLKYSHAKKLRLKYIDFFLRG